MDRSRHSAPELVAQDSVRPARYRVIEQVGQGGMGVVYRVHDALHGREVALKRLRAQSQERHVDDSGEASLRSMQGKLAMLFQREYHTLAELAHPNIIEVFDYGVDAEGAYYTMELLAGSDLQQLAPLPWPRACGLLRDVAAALTLLHARRLLHRDISPRNVRCIEDGRAKLIDFGAMTPMGVEQLLAGTPPFVPPEALARQSLDARADVFALGALAYWMLTGRHAFPARTWRAVRDAWRSAPALPSVFAADVPEALDALVMRMLSLDRQGRPNTAVELVERLSALAGLEPQAACEISTSAYLTTPTLVARGPQIVAVRRRMVRALVGHGASVLVSGPPGVGRSRFLDACVLEAKLAGALVLRIGRSDSASGAYGGVRALLEQLSQLVSGRDRGSLPPQANNALRATGREPADDLARPQTQAALLAYLTRIAGTRLLAIAVDDAEALDEPTFALLAALATQVGKSKLVLITTCAARGAHDSSPALRVLRDASHEVALQPFAPHETEELLRSVFGDVPNLGFLAARIHALSGGVPLLCMELAQHLVDRGVIAYRSGGFVLPLELPASALPASLHDALRAKVEALSINALAIGSWLALAGSEPLTMGECVELCAGGDAGPVYLAVNELLAARTVHLEGERIRLAHDHAPAFEALLEDEQRVLLHRGLADLLSRDPYRCVRAAEHWLAAQEPERAVDALLSYVRHPDAHAAWFSEYLPVLEAGIAASLRCRRPAADTFTLRYALARAITTYLEPADREQLLALAEELCDLAGLHFHAQLGDETDPLQRVTRAIQLAAARHEATPEHERTLAPIEAIRAFVTYHGLLASYGSYTLDVELLHRMPSLESFRALAPAIAFTDKIGRASRELRAERGTAARTLLLECYHELAEPGALGFDEARRNAARARLLYGIALGRAVLGAPDSEQHAEALSREPDQRVNAWRLRYVSHLYRPDVERAQQCRREIELLALQGGPRQYAQGGNFETEIIVYARSDDLLGLRRIRPELAQMADKHPGLLPWLAVTDGELERICGRPERALALQLEAMELAEPGRHVAWPQAAGFALDALLLLGRHAEARERGRVWHALALEHRLDSAPLIEMPLLVAEALLGHASVARKASERLLSEIAERGIHGLYLGLAYETLARVAIVQGDEAGFQAAFARCSEEYGGGKYPPLNARLERLTTEARRAKIASATHEGEHASTVTVARVQQQLTAQLDPQQRAQQALALVLEASGAVAGFLYGVRAAEIEPLASRAPDQSAAASIETMLRGSLSVRVEHQDQDHTVALAAAADAHTLSAPAESVVTDGFGLRYFPFALVGAHDDRQRPMVAAVLALAFADGRCGTLAPSIAAAIGAELLAHKDVTGLTLL